MHGITEDFLADKPNFAQIAEDFLQFVSGAELIIHNAPFDIGFLDSELGRLPDSTVKMSALCAIIDTLSMARARHPGQRNTLDALCQRYTVDNSRRDLHGALLDAEILADVYLVMTGGQTTLQLSEAGQEEGGQARAEGIKRLPAGRRPLPVLAASADERAAHEAQLDAIAAANGGRVVWRDAPGH